MNCTTNLIIPRKFFICITILIITIVTSACNPAAGGQATLLPTMTPFSLEAPESSPTAGPTPTQTTTPVPTATLDPHEPVWIVNPVDQVVLGIDPNSNTVTRRITIQGRPDQVISGEGGVWALDRKRGIVYRIDPQSQQVRKRIPLPEGQAETITAGAGFIWVGLTGRVDLTAQTPGLEPLPLPGWVVQIDPQKNQVLNQYAVQPVSRLVANGSLVWVLSRSDIDTPVQVLDLAVNQGMAVPLRNVPEWFVAEALAVDSKDLWLFSTAYGKIYRSTVDGYTLSAIPLEERQPTGYADLLLTGSGLWAATPWGSVLHIDPASNHVLATINLDVPLTRLIAGHNAIWAVSEQTGGLFRIDPAKDQVVAQVSTGSALQPTVIPSPTPRVVIWKPCKDSPTSRLKVGDLAYVTKDPPVPNRVRKEANREAEILGFINPGASMNIIEGPACSDGWVWWKVKNADLEGWTAEGDKETYWLVPLFQ